MYVYISNNNNDNNNNNNDNSTLKQSSLRTYNKTKTIERYPTGLQWFDYQTKKRHKTQINNNKDNANYKRKSKIQNTYQTSTPTQKKLKAQQRSTGGASGDGRF